MDLLKHHQQQVQQLQEQQKLLQQQRQQQQQMAPPLNLKKSNNNINTLKNNNNKVIREIKEVVVINNGEKEDFQKEMVHHEPLKSESDEQDKVQAEQQLRLQQQSQNRYQNHINTEKSNVYEKIKLVEINTYLTCYLCKGYLIDATTISECLHSFCRSCIIKFLQENCYCPVCEVIINKAKPCLKPDKTLQDIVYKLVPELFVKEMARRRQFYQKHPDLIHKVTPEERGEDIERTIFNPHDPISLSIEYISDDSSPRAIPHLLSTGTNSQSAEPTQDNPMRRYLQCPAMCRIEVLKKFVRNKYNVDTSLFHIDILYKRVPLPDHYTLIDIGYIYSWKRNEPMKFFFRITDITKVTERFDYFDTTRRDVVTPKVTPRSARRRPQPQPKVVAVKKPKVAAAATKTAKVNKCYSGSEVTSKSSASDDNPYAFDDSSDANFVCAKTYTKTTTGRSVRFSDVTTSIVDKSPPTPPPPPGPPKVFTNITLNRDDNVETITKVTLDKDQSKCGVDEEKSKFLKSIELTPKSPPSTTKDPPATSQKRKNTSPVKLDKAKRPKVAPSTSSGKPMKIIIQPKSIHNPQVRQMVSNVNHGVNTMSKIVEQTTTSDIKSLIDTCKINIPASLSITLNESGDSAQTPMAPVKNYIEILKLPNENKRQSFQKIFEEAVVGPKTSKAETKRNILEIASQLHKKSKVDDTSSANGGEIPAKLAMPKKTKSPLTSPTSPRQVKTSTSMHSPTLGLNYTVSVNQTPSPPTKTLKVTVSTNHTPPSPSTSHKATGSPNQSPPSTTHKATGSTNHTPLSPCTTHKATASTNHTPTPQSTSHKPNHSPPSSTHKATGSTNHPPTPQSTSHKANHSPPSSTHKATKSTNHTPPSTAHKAAPPPPSNTPKPTNSPNPAPSTSLKATVSTNQTPSTTPKVSASANQTTPHSKPPKATTGSANQTPSSRASKAKAATPNQLLLDKYDIPNLAQLSARLNFNNSGAQLGALQHALMLKHFEQQHQNWVKSLGGSAGSQAVVPAGGGAGGTLLNYEKYLQALASAAKSNKGKQGAIMNVKEH